ncbi:MAG: hypothetical protein JWR15_500 [Prosthecobacter sp.]|nr:hypothetical protein [Prosthecobacter sp.]
MNGTALIIALTRRAVRPGAAAAASSIREVLRAFRGFLKGLSVDQQSEIAGDICDAAKAMPEHHVSAVFFKRFRQLCVGGYYSHRQSWKSLGYGAISAFVPSVLAFCRRSSISRVCRMGF